MLAGRRLDLEPEPIITQMSPERTPVICNEGSSRGPGVPSLVTTVEGTMLHLTVYTYRREQGICLLSDTCYTLESVY